MLCRPFVGRREELAYLRERRLEAGSSRGGVVLVTGDAGVGKSRLLSEFCWSLENSRWRIAAVSCLEFAQRPYGPILDALVRLDGAFAGIEPADSKQGQLDAIVGRFRGLCARGALLVVVEDVHWADAATIDLLLYLGSTLRSMRLLLLLSFRSDQLHPDHPVTSGVGRIERTTRAGRIDLAPLRGSELRTFIDEALAATPLSDETRRAVALAGDGNPFFTEELLKNAVERVSERVDERTRRDLPQTLRTVLLERLRPFDLGERGIVAQAAVIGRTFGLDLLASTLGTTTDALLPALRRARDFQIVEELSPSTFRFRHGLTREAIYEEFLGSELRPLHRSIASALEDTPEDARSLEALAYHSWSAGDGERAVRYNELAGDAAAGVYAYEDAIAFYDRALEAVGVEPIRRASIVEKIAELRIVLNAMEPAGATYGVAADIYRDSGDYDREAFCRVRAAIVAYTIGLPNPTASLETMLARLDPGEYLARSRVHVGLAWLAATFWFPTRARHHLDRVDPRALLVAADIRLRFHNISAWIAMTFGELPTFRFEFDRWVDVALENGSVRAIAGAYVNGGLCFSMLGLHDEALACIDKARRVARESRDRHAEEGCHAFAAMCHLMRGDLKRARAAVEAVSISTENHVNSVFASACGTLAGAYLDDRVLIEKWFDGVQGLVADDLQTECGAGFAEILVRRGRPEEAAALLHRVLPDCELIRGNVYTLLAVGRYGASRDRARVRSYLLRASGGPVETPERPALALFDAIALQTAGKIDEAATCAREAAAGFRRLGMPLLEAAALEIAGDAQAALALYRRCGAAFDMRRLGSSDVSSLAVESEDAGDGGVLSAREGEIVVLAARGRSNLEIARELAISHKTVEKHLGAAFRKLGVTSRRELAAHIR